MLSGDSVRSSVSELVKTYDPYADGVDRQGKRDRSESGDSGPASKRGALDRSASCSLVLSATQVNKVVKTYLDSALERLEDRLSVTISQELSAFKTDFHSRFESLYERLGDLERHVEERDCVIEDLRTELDSSKEELKALRDRIEDAEIISRLPCLILSGGRMAARH